MTSLALESDPLAADVRVTPDTLIVDLTDGRTLSVPIEWFPRLATGDSEERANFRLLGNGYAIEWPDLDEHIGVGGLLAGRGSGESERSFERWLERRQREEERE